MSQLYSKACSCSSPVNIWETSLLGPTILLAEYSRTSSNRRTKYLDVAKDAGEKSMMAQKRSTQEKATQETLHLNKISDFYTL